MKKITNVFAGFSRNVCGIALVFSMCSVSIFNNASAQSETDYTKMFPIKSEFSIDNHPIIRCVDEYTRLILDHRYYDRGDVFTLFSDNSDQMLDLWLPEEWHITDHIIKDKVVYFCGKENVPNNGSKAIMGYFRLADYPNCYVHHFIPEEFSLFKKMEVMEDQNGKPIVALIAVKHDNSETLVLSSEEEYDRHIWQLIVMDDVPGFSNHKFVDLAVTNDFLLATSIYERGISQGFLWFFERNTSNNPLSIGGQWIVKYPLKGITDLRVEACGDNKFYFGQYYNTTMIPAERGEYPFALVATNGEGGLFLDFFNGLSHFNHLYTSASPFTNPHYELNTNPYVYKYHSPYPLRDVSYCEHKHHVQVPGSNYSYDVLMDELRILYYTHGDENRNSYSSHILRIPRERIQDNIGDFVDDMIFSDYSIWSLAHKKKYAQFVAAGSSLSYYDPENINTLLNIFYQCPRRYMNCPTNRLVLLLASNPPMRPEPINVKAHRIISHINSDQYFNDSRQSQIICEDSHPGLGMTRNIYGFYHSYINANSSANNTLPELQHDQNAEVTYVDFTGERPISMMATANTEGIQLSISPNPANSRVEIRCNTEINHLEVYNASGVQMILENVDGKIFSFDVSGWAKGIYNVVAKTNDGITSQKLVVK